MKQIPKVNCATCMKRSSCQALCPAAELYTNQDNVPSGRELLMSEILYRESSPWAENNPDTPYTSYRDLMIATLLSAGIPRDAIRKQFKLSAVTLRQVIRRLRNKWID